ncbi:MAG: patatin-like phospholipase family protein [Clostridium sp.]|uniref:patatin-like phospholipase family protein n=1 Tax=Clostridium TaxID=1485 RepID=UPI0028FF10C3|nr:patatin-like phospholipase family protein [Clostridium sp.]MDU1602877.1 patatin-like phospholipase family protein [Clostridium sp.]
MEKDRIGLALSGGGSRAIAFHLGCLRALNKKGVLDNIDVISTVSGGSVIGAIYAYECESFEEFDKRVVELLKKGLVKSIIREFVFSKDVVFELFTSCIKPIYYILKKLRIKLPIKRTYSRTSAFIRALDKQIFNGEYLTNVRRNNLDVVINGTEMRTGTAFRFGNNESGCWRFGRVKDNNIKVAEAVGASAAYPVLLPSIDIKMTFEKNEHIENKRVLISDGGIYDNLGISCFYPDKNSNYSYNAYKVDYIICCNAGYGMFDDSKIPFGWTERMIRSFETVMKKNQDASMSTLHKYNKNDEIKGFIMPYLGQQDKALYSIKKDLADLVKREEVNYPTDFNAMNINDIENLSKRGEQLTEMLLESYLPELCYEKDSTDISELNLAEKSIEL